MTHRYSVSILSSVYFPPLIPTALALENRDMLAAKKKLQSSFRKGMIRSQAWAEMTKDRLGKGQAKIVSRVKKNGSVSKRHSHTLPHAHTHTHDPEFLQASDKVDTLPSSLMCTVVNKSPAQSYSIKL